MAAGSPPSPAAERPPALTGVVPLVGGGAPTLAFIIFGLAALGTGAAGLGARPDLLNLPHTHPAVTALAHLWLPGFLLSACMGAVYQLMPVALGSPLQLRLRWVWSHLGLHATGVLLLVTGFNAGRFVAVAAGGILVAAGTWILAAGTLRTFAASRRRDAVAWCFPLATAWLGATAASGVILALNRHQPFLPLAVTDLLGAHAHAGIAGFFVTLLQGATFQLVPMFTLADVRHPRLVPAGLALGQLGLIAAVIGIGYGAHALVVSGSLILLAGLACSGAAFVATWRARRRRRLDAGLQAFRLGAVLLALGALGGVLLSGADRVAHTPSAFAYGLILIVGALGAMVLGMLCKIVPFLVWMKAYGPRAGRAPVPRATDLGLPALERGWLLLHAAAIVLLGLSPFVASPQLHYSARLLLCVSVVLFLGNLAGILRHLIRPTATGTVRPPLPSFR